VPLQDPVRLVRYSDDHMDIAPLTPPWKKIALSASAEQVFVLCTQYYVL
jgi:hypothetical protein